MEKNGQKRVAIYARVSTLDKGQDPQTQLRQLREYASARGFGVVGEFVDYASGTREDRAQYKALFALARRRSVDVVLVWRYDRFARSVRALINALKEFQSLGVDFISYQENIDTTTPQGEMVFTIMASLAQFESALLGERTRAGMERARAEGKTLGRKRVSDEKKAEARKLRAEGLSIAKIARAVGLSHGTVWNIVSAASEPS